MTFPNHPPPPPPPFLPPPPFAKVDFYRQNDVDRDDEESNAHASKRPRTLINPQSNPNNFPRMNPPNPLLNRGTGYIFYKTRMCLKFLDGNCRNGESCTFAHGQEDLREPPPNWQEIVGRKENNNYDDQRNIHRFKICKKYANGEECPYGENCNFLHKRATMPSFDADVDGPRESSAIRIGINVPMSLPMSVPMNGPMSGSMNGPYNGPMNGSMNGPVMGLRNEPSQFEVVDSIENTHGVPASDDSRVTMSPYWKTKICSKWEITGYCPFGEKCHFAHGEAELQLPGVRIDTEAMNILSSVPATKSVFVPPTATTDINTALVSPTTDNNRIKKISEKWKGPKKINMIYGDWLDDMSPPLTWPKNVDN